MARTTDDGSRQHGGTQDAFFRTGQPVPLPMLERAEGIRVWDEEGNAYLDAGSGPMVSCLGHGNVAVLEAMRTQAGRLEYAFTRVARNRPNLEYSGRLASIAGPGFERVSLASGGSEAIDAAMKFLRSHAVATGQGTRRHIISLMPSYHGATIASAAMSGDPTQAAILDGFAVRSPTVPAPLSYRLPDDHTVDSFAAVCATALEHRIVELGPENVLAFIVEPVGGLSTGAVVPPTMYFARIHDICARYGVHLVFDEVLCGVARTGRFLATHHWAEARPDIVVLAKGLGAGYSPLGAFLAPTRLVDELAERTGFESSYSSNANPVSCAVGLAVLEEIERLGLVVRAEIVGARLRRGLDEIAQASPIVGDVRGLGMLLAVELVGDKTTMAALPAESMPTERIRVHGLRNGLLLYSRQTAGGRFGHWFMVAPPLIIGDDECDELLERIAATLDDFTGELLAAGHI